MSTVPPIRDWIDSVCRRSSRVTGWPLVFESAGHPKSQGTRSADARGPSPWRSSVSNGTEIVGTLRLAPQRGRERDERYLRACEVADLTAHLIKCVLTERASNDRLRVSNPPGPIRPTGSGVSVMIERRVPRRAALPHVQALLRTAVRQSGFPAAAVFIQEPGTSELRLQAQQAPGWLQVPQRMRQLSQASVDGHCLNGELRVLQRSSASEEQADLLPDHVSIGVCRGITVAGRSLGTLWLYDRRDRRLTLREQHTIASVAERLGELIERTRLLDESERSQRLRVELQVAARSQPAARLHQQGTAAWYELAGHSEASEEVGGDLLEVIPLPDDRVLVAVGDAAGHSIPAAMMMACVRGVLRALFDRSALCRRCVEIPAPHEVLQRVNSVLHGIVHANQFMTLFCAIVDGPRMQIEYANAGHPPVLLIRSGEVRSLDSHGLVLGVLEDASYSSTILPVLPGDLFALHTDGVSEAIDDSQRMFGAEGIAAILQCHRNESAATILDHVWAGLQQHLSGHTVPDDRTVAVLRINRPITLAHARSPEASQHPH